MNVLSLLFARPSRVLSRCNAFFTFLNVGRADTVVIIAEIAILVDADFCFFQ